jgi:hypothetical protein
MPDLLTFDPLPSADRLRSNPTDCNRTVAAPQKRVYLLVSTPPAHPQLKAVDSALLPKEIPVRRSYKFATALCAVIAGSGITPTSPASAAADAADPVGATNGFLVAPGSVPNTWTYLDAGNAGWVAAANMATYLNNAGRRVVAASR